MGVVALPVGEGGELEEFGRVSEAWEVLKVVWGDVLKELVLELE